MSSSIRAYVIHGIKLTAEDVEKIASSFYESESDKITAKEEDYQDLLYYVTRDDREMCGLHINSGNDSRYYFGYELACDSWDNGDETMLKKVPDSFDKFYDFLKKYKLEARPPRTFLVINYCY